MTERDERSGTAGTRPDRWLADRMADGDPHARELLVERSLPLAKTLARRYASNSETYEDVFQVACVGLLKAVDGYDTGRGCAFSTYAVPTIVGELKRYFRDRTWTVRPPRDLLERALRVERATETLRERQHTAPTVRQIAEHLQISQADTLEGILAACAQRGTSLDAAVAGADEARTLADAFGTVDEGFAHAEERILVGQLGRGLTEHDREILRLRFKDDLTQTEIGARLGISQMQVSRLIRRALERLRAVAEHDSRLAAV